MVGDMEQVKRVKEVKEDSEVVVKQKRGRRRTEEEVSVMVEEEEGENTPMMVSNNPHLLTVVIKPRMVDVSSRFCLLPFPERSKRTFILHGTCLLFIVITKNSKRKPVPLANQW